MNGGCKGSGEGNGTTPSAMASTGVIIPLYMPPGTAWTTIINVKKAHPNVPLIAIVNPSNGPGTGLDSNYYISIQDLQAAGIVVIGYIYTSYTSRDISSVETDIDKWKSWYNVTGIFFDEMSNTLGGESYYRTLNSYAKSTGPTYTIGNPGTDTIASYLGTVDNLVIYEDSGVPSLSSLTGWHAGFDKKNFSFLAYGAENLDMTFEKSAATDVGWLYITNDTLPNPWDTLPPYLSQEIGTLEGN